MSKPETSSQEKDNSVQPDTTISRTRGKNPSQTKERKVFGSSKYEFNTPVTRKHVDTSYTDVENGKFNEPRKSAQLSDSSHSPSSESSPHLDSLVKTLFTTLAADTSRNLAEIPHLSGYANDAQTLVELNHSFRREMAARLQPAFNAHIQAMPHGTYEEKKALARWVNEELRRFDLAVKCPKTGQPSLIHAGPGNHPEIGRFQLEHKTAEGKNVRSVNTPELPYIELMEAAPRREALAEWREKVGREGGGAKRG